MRQKVESLKKKKLESKQGLTPNITNVSKSHCLINALLFKLLFFSLFGALSPDTKWNCSDLHWSASAASA